MHFDERRVFLFTRERQKFAKVFHKQKGEDSQKSFSRKRQRFAKSIPQEKAEFCKSILSILVFWRSNQIVWVVYKGMKKTFKFIISISEQKLQWQSQDLITCGLHYPSATGLRSRDGRKPRPAKRVGRLWSCSTAPRLLLEQDSSRIKRTTPHTRNKYEHLVRWKSNTKCKLVII